LIAYVSPAWLRTPSSKRPQILILSLSKDEDFTTTLEIAFAEP
jgi:hypothetical protein